MFFSQPTQTIENLYSLLYISIILYFILYFIISELAIFNTYWDSVEDKAALLIDLLELSPKCEILLELLDREGLQARDLQHVFTSLGNVLLM